MADPLLWIDPKTPLGAAATDAARALRLPFCSQPIAAPDDQPVWIAPICLLILTAEGAQPPNWGALCGLQIPMMHFECAPTPSSEQDQWAGRAIRAWLKKHAPEILWLQGEFPARAILHNALQRDAECVCGRLIPSQVWESEEFRTGQPIQCSRCGHQTFAASFDLHKSCAPR